jgi:hypothetical protein
MRRLGRASAPEKHHMAARRGAGRGGLISSPSLRELGDHISGTYLLRYANGGRGS